MAKRGIKQGGFLGEGKSVFTNKWTIILVIVAVITTLFILNIIDNGKVLFGACLGNIATDYDNDGKSAIKYDSYCKASLGGDNCPTVYNPDQNNKYCNPFYGQTLLANDDSDKDFIPNTPKYSNALGFYISDIAPNVFTDIKTRAIRVQTSSTGTPTDRVLASTELYKLAQQGSYSSPSPSPTSTSSPSY